MGTGRGDQEYLLFRTENSTTTTLSEIRFALMRSRASHHVYLIYRNHRYPPSSSSTVPSEGKFFLTCS
eukprot:7586928-Pyramimonas_sp.AAC.1